MSATECQYGNGTRSLLRGREGHGPTPAWHVDGCCQACIISHTFVWAISSDPVRHSRFSYTSLSYSCGRAGGHQHSWRHHKTKELIRRKVACALSASRKKH